MFFFFLVIAIQFIKYYFKNKKIKKVVILNRQGEKKNIFVGFEVEWMFLTKWAVALFSTLLCCLSITHLLLHSAKKASDIWIFLIFFFSFFSPLLQFEPFKLNRPKTYFSKTVSNCYQNFKHMYFPIWIVIKKCISKILALFPYSNIVSYKKKSQEKFVRWTKLKWHLFSLKPY